LTHQLECAKIKNTMWPFAANTTTNITSGSIAPSGASAGPSKQMSQPEMMEAIMDALVDAGHADFLLIGNQQIREWWEGVNYRRQQTREAQERLEKQRKLRESALSKLTAEELEVLGIKSTSEQETIDAIMASFAYANSSKKMLKEITSDVHWDYTSDRYVPDHYKDIKF
jgi:hypothetical protein